MNGLVIALIVLASVVLAYLLSKIAFCFIVRRRERDDSEVIEEKSWKDVIWLSRPENKDDKYWNVQGMVNVRNTNFD